MKYGNRFFSKSFSRPILFVVGNVASLSRKVAAGSAAVYQDFYDVSSIKEEVKDDDDSIGMSISTKGSFGSRLNKYKPGASKSANFKLAAKQPNSLAPIDEYIEESSAYKSRASQSKPRSKASKYAADQNTSDPVRIEKKGKVPLRHVRRVARNEQMLSGGPGSSPSAVNGHKNISPGDESDKKMINSGTSLSDLLLVSSEGNLPMIDILSRVAPEKISGGNTAGMTGPGNDGDIELWANNRHSRFALFMDDDINEPKPNESPKMSGHQTSEKFLE